MGSGHSVCFAASAAPDTLPAPDIVRSSSDALTFSHSRSRSCEPKAPGQEHGRRRRSASPRRASSTHRGRSFSTESRGDVRSRSASLLGRLRGFFNVASPAPPGAVESPSTTPNGGVEHPLVYPAAQSPPFAALLPPAANHGAPTGGLTPPGDSFDRRRAISVDAVSAAVAVNAAVRADGLQAAAVAVAGLSRQPNRSVSPRHPSTPNPDCRTCSRSHSASVSFTDQSAAHVVAAKKDAASESALGLESDSAPSQLRGFDAQSDAMRTSQDLATTDLGSSHSSVAQRGDGVAPFRVVAASIPSAPRPGPGDTGSSSEKPPSPPGDEAPPAGDDCIPEAGAPKKDSSASRTKSNSSAPFGPMLTSPDGPTATTSPSPLQPPISPPAAVPPPEAHPQPPRPPSPMHAATATYHTQTPSVSSSTPSIARPPVQTVGKYTFLLANQVFGTVSGKTPPKPPTAPRPGPAPAAAQRFMFIGGRSGPAAAPNAAPAAPHRPAVTKIVFPVLPPPPPMSYDQKVAAAAYARRTIAAAERNVRAAVEAEDDEAQPQRLTGSRSFSRRGVGPRFPTRREHSAVRDSRRLTSAEANVMTTTAKILFGHCCVPPRPIAPDRSSFDGVPAPTLHSDRGPSVDFLFAASFDTLDPMRSLGPGPQLETSLLGGAARFPGVGCANSLSLSSSRSRKNTAKSVDRAPSTTSSDHSGLRGILRKSSPGSGASSLHSSRAVSIALPDGSPAGPGGTTVASVAPAAPDVNLVAEQEPQRQPSDTVCGVAEDEACAPLPEGSTSFVLPPSVSAAVQEWRNRSSSSGTTTTTTRTPRHSRDHSTPAESDLSHAVASPGPPEASHPTEQSPAAALPSEPPRPALPAGLQFLPRPPPPPTLTPAVRGRARGSTAQAVVASQAADQCPVPDTDSVSSQGPAVPFIGLANRRAPSEQMQEVTMPLSPSRNSLAPASVALLSALADGTPLTNAPRNTDDPPRYASVDVHRLSSVTSGVPSQLLPALGVGFHAGALNVTTVQDGWSTTTVQHSTSARPGAHLSGSEQQPHHTVAEGVSASASAIALHVGRAPTPQLSPPPSPGPEAYCAAPNVPLLVRTAPPSVKAEWLALPPVPPPCAPGLSSMRQKKIKRWLLETGVAAAPPDTPQSLMSLGARALTPDIMEWHVRMLRSNTVVGRQPRKPAQGQHAVHLTGSASDDEDDTRRASTVRIADRRNSVLDALCDSGSDAGPEGTHVSDLVQLEAESRRGSRASMC